VAGYWNSTHNEAAIEGEDRQSRYLCFKSHHQFEQLEGSTDGDESLDKVIYVVRDPRDIVVSGAHFFSIERWQRLGRVFDRLPNGRQVYRKSVNRVISPMPYRIARMVDTVLRGSDSISHWMGVPWAEHYAPYQSANCLFVQYESLLEEPLEGAREIADFVGVGRSQAELKRAIGRQSFAAKRKVFRERNEREKLRYLRSGVSRQWETELSPRQKARFRRELAEELEGFGYPLEG